MSVPAHARIISAIVAVLVLLQPFLRMACVFDSSPAMVCACVQQDSDRDTPQGEPSLEGADHELQMKTAFRRARISNEKISVCVAPLFALAVHLTQIAGPTSEFTEFGTAFDAFDTRSHETRGKPLTTSSSS